MKLIDIDNMVAVDLVGDEPNQVKRLIENGEIENEYGDVVCLGDSLDLQVDLCVDHTVLDEIKLRLSL